MLSPLTWPSLQRSRATNPSTLGLSVRLQKLEAAQSMGNAAVVTSKGHLRQQRRCPQPSPAFLPGSLDCWPPSWKLPFMMCLVPRWQGPQCPPEPARLHSGPLQQAPAALASHCLVSGPHVPSLGCSLCPLCWTTAPGSTARGPAHTSTVLQASLSPSRAAEWEATPGLLAWSSEAVDPVG